MSDKHVIFAEADAETGRIRVLSPTDPAERLCQAAPDLLAALKEVYAPFCDLVDQMNRFSPDGVSSEGYQTYMAMVQRMHAAIAKAEGRTS